MKGSKDEIIQLLQESDQKGVLLINDIPYEVHLNQSGELEFTGKGWRWEKTTAPSSHGDYQIETDELIKQALPEIPALTETKDYDFFKNVDTYLNSGY